MQRCFYNMRSALGASDTLKSDRISPSRSGRNGEYIQRKQKDYQKWNLAVKIIIFKLVLIETPSMLYVKIRNTNYFNCAIIREVIQLYENTNGGHRKNEII